MEIRAQGGAVVRLGMYLTQAQTENNKNKLCTTVHLAMNDVLLSVNFIF